MKLKNKIFEDVVVGAEKEMDFSIDTDNHLIFEILRDKMYKDKIGSICREVLSNSRDANRESGSDKNVSVTIIEPNQLVYVGHQSVAFKDNGIGITPDRMADIYVKYAASTKTGSDEQTGGFGLGAKTPFAYNDTFTVVTVCDYEGKRMKYFYTALIDSSRKGKMILFDTQETTDETGTEVIVPIKTPDDRYQFEKKVFFYSKYWGCVDYINFNIDTDTPKIVKDTPLYLVAEDTETSLIIDGIPYPVESNWGFANLSMQSGYGIGLKFKTGELTISANRESVQYDEETVECIKVLSETVKQDFVELLDDMIDNFPTYLDACKFKTKMDDGFFPDFEKGTMNHVLSAAIGTGHYNNYMLTSHYKTKTIQFQGRDVVSKIRFEHYKVERVRDKHFNSYSKAKIYKDYESLPLKQLTDTNDIYLNTKAKSSRRNETIFDGEIGEYFWMLIKKPLSSDVDAEAELKQVETDFGLTYEIYQDVVPMPVERKARATGKIGASICKGWKNDLIDCYYDSSTKTLWEDENCDYPLELKNFVFAPVDNVRTRRSWAYGFPQSEDISFLGKHGYEVILVAHGNWDRKVSKVAGVVKAKDQYDKIVKDNHDKWVEEGKRYIAKRVISHISSNLLNFIEVLPENTLPEYIRAFDVDELDNADNLESSYHRVKGSIKVDTDGLANKLKKNLDKYPLLNSYIQYADIPVSDKKEQIKQYIKQVENYEN